MWENQTPMQITMLATPTQVLRASTVTHKTPMTMASIVLNGLKRFVMNLLFTALLSAACRLSVQVLISISQSIEILQFLRYNDGVQHSVDKPRSGHNISGSYMRIRKNSGQQSRDEINIIANCSDALAHPVRVELFGFIYRENLERRTVCNKDLVELFPYSQSTISQHMNSLLSSGLVEAQYEGPKTNYFVTSECSENT